MEKNLIFKTVGLVAISIGAFAIGTAFWANFKKRKAEEDTAKAIVDAEVIAQNFSGVDNRRNPKHNNLSEKHNNFSRKMFNGNGYEQINTGGLEGFTRVAPRTAPRTFSGNGDGNSPESNAKRKGGTVGCPSGSTWNGSFCEYDKV